MPRAEAVIAKVMGLASALPPVKAATKLRRRSGSSRWLAIHFPMDVLTLIRHSSGSPAASDQNGTILILL